MATFNATVGPLIFALCVFLSDSRLLAADEALPEINTIIKNVAAGEHALKNVKIQNFELKLQLLPPGAAEWQTSEYSEAGTAWYDGAPLGKARVNISRHVTEWEDGKAPWLETQLDVGYDGQIGWVANYQSGPPGKLQWDNSGQLLPDAPVQLRDPYQAFADGTAYSLYFYLSSGLKSQFLSDKLAAGIARGGMFKISWDNQYGDRLIRLMGGDKPDGHVGYWFDPAHGYAIRKFESIGHIPNGPIIKEILEVPELCAAGPGVWFPLRATREQSAPGKPGTQMKLSFHADKVIANDPNFDEHIFSPAFPKNVWITDKIHGGAFYATDEKTIAQRIDADLAAMNKQPTDHETSGGGFSPNK